MALNVAESGIACLFVQLGGDEPALAGQSSCSRRLSLSSASTGYVPGLHVGCVLAQLGTLDSRVLMGEAFAGKSGLIRR